MADKNFKSPSAMRRAILAWYDRYRRVLPWRAPAGQMADPYHVWLSEIMLQQTTVATVGPYFLYFRKRWPTVDHLAAADLDDILHGWQGLGYYARARNMLRCAKIVSEDLNGYFPNNERALRNLPGIGAYTSAAISAIAFGKPANVVDGNVERVMARFYAIEEPLPGCKDSLRALSAKIAPRTVRGRPGDFAQAVMDLGATVCTARHPRCSSCPVSDNCSSYPVLIGGQSDVQRLPRVPFYGSSRYYRGRIIQILRAIPPGEGLTLDVVGEKIKSDFVKEDEPWLWNIVAKLTKEGLIDLLGCHGQSNTVPVFLAEHPS